MVLQNGIVYHLRPSRNLRFPDTFPLYKINDKFKILKIEQYFIFIKNLKRKSLIGNSCFLKMNPEELAIQLAQHVHYNELKEPLLQNLYNVQHLLRTIEDLKKQLYNKQRDVDVLIFELANYKPDVDEYDRPDPLTITNEANDTDDEFI
jgi:hypothetical protein